jgi:hypothetical protein
MNMILLTGIFNSLIFILLASVHIYWALGGRRGAEYAIPSNPSRNKLSFNPGIVPTLIVAAGLLLFAITLLYSIGLIHYAGLEQYKKMSLLVISIIFLIRAVGEFRYIGLTRKISDTKFGVYDARYYTPLSIWLGVSIFILAFNTISS